MGERSGACVGVVSTVARLPCLACTARGAAVVGVVDGWLVAGGTCLSCFGAGWSAKVLAAACNVRWDEPAALPSLPRFLCSPFGFASSLHCVFACLCASLSWRVCRRALHGTCAGVWGVPGGDVVVTSLGGRLAPARLSAGRQGPGWGGLPFWLFDGWRRWAGVDGCRVTGTHRTTMAPRRVRHVNSVLAAVAVLVCHWSGVEGGWATSLGLYAGLVWCGRATASACSADGRSYGRGSGGWGGHAAVRCGCGGLWTGGGVVGRGTSN